MYSTETAGASDVMCDVVFPFILAAAKPHVNQGSVCMGPDRPEYTQKHTHTQSQSTLLSVAVLPVLQSWKPATDVCPIRISLLWARKAVTTIHLHASIFSLMGQGQTVAGR